jgi:hypothetical protein
MERTMNGKDSAAWLQRMEPEIECTLDLTSHSYDEVRGRVWMGRVWLEKASAMGWEDRELCSFELMREMMLGVVLMVTPDVILLQRPDGQQVRVKKGKPYSPPKRRSPTPPKAA